MSKSGSTSRRAVHHVVADADGEVELGLGLGQLVEHRLDAGPE